MIKNILFLAVLFFSISGGAQINYKLNGNIVDSENNTIAPDKIRALLSGNEKLLSEYNSGRTKKTVGNILLIGGIGLTATDVLIEVFSPTKFDENLETKKRYPSALTYVGLAAVVISIPIKIGFSKKIKHVVEEYNKPSAATGYLKKTELITNQNGVGFRLTFN